jgi:hypothetical protein
MKDDKKQADKLRDAQEAEATTENLAVQHGCHCHHHCCCSHTCCGHLYYYIWQQPYMYQPVTNTGGYYSTAINGAAAGYSTYQVNF